MDGRPVWLASFSLWNQGRNIPTAEWTLATRRKAESQLKTLLQGAGDPSRERVFRMCLTLCYHRGLSPEEEEQLPDAHLPEDQKIIPYDLAGGPLEILRVTGVKEAPSSMPCHSPRKKPLGDGLFFPLDCGECPPCRAREAIYQEQVAKAEARGKEAVRCP